MRKEIVKVISQTQEVIDGEDTCVVSLSTGEEFTISSHRLVNEDTYFRYNPKYHNNKQSEIKVTERESDLITRFLSILDKHFTSTLSTEQCEFK